MKSFVFLYPIKQIFDLEIKNNYYGKKGSLDEFRQKCSNLLNLCIHLRYRQKGFIINYIVFDDCRVCNIIRPHSGDKIIKAGLDFKTHTNKKVYPDQDFILNQLGKTDTICIAGFHMWDCVEKLARKSYERQINTLVDEDLTEFFFWRINDDNFNINKYPSIDPKRLGKELFKEFMKPRKSRPWLYQNY